MWYAMEKVMNGFLVMQNSTDEHQTPQTIVQSCRDTMPLHDINVHGKVLFLLIL
jgi:hypothetical protein